MEEYLKRKIEEIHEATEVSDFRAQIDELSNLLDQLEPLLDMIKTLDTEEEVDELQKAVSESRANVELLLAETQKLEQLRGEANAIFKTAGSDEH